MSPSEGQSPVIGLLGGIAAGKTTVAKMLAELGAVVVSADAIGHAVLEKPETRERIAARWGREVFDEGGKVDCGKLSQRVFGDPEELAALEAITHPPIVAAMRQQIEEARSSADVAGVVVDAPLLLEAELDGLCDVLVFIDCPRDVRLQRAGARGWDALELNSRESHQQPLELKRQRARFTIDGNTSLETTFQQVQQLWQETLGL
jgi:dephospho-CoA kinase